MAKALVYIFVWSCKAFECDDDLSSRSMIILTVVVIAQRFVKMVLVLELRAMTKVNRGGWMEGKGGWVGRWVRLFTCTLE